MIINTSILSYLLCTIRHYESHPKFFACLSSSLMFGNDDQAKKQSINVNKLTLHIKNPLPNMSSPKPHPWFSHTHLSEYPYLEDEWEYNDLYDDGNVEDVVESVGDQPVCPATQTILLHHNQVPLILVFHYSRHEYLGREREREKAELEIAVGHDQFLYFICRSKPEIVGHWCPSNSFFLENYIARDWTQSITLTQRGGAWHHGDLCSPKIPKIQLVAQFNLNSSIAVTYIQSAILSSFLWKSLSNFEAHNSLWKWQLLS